MRSAERMVGTYEKLVPDEKILRKFPELKKAIAHPELRDICEWICAGGAETPEMRKRMYELAFSGRVEKKWKKRKKLCGLKCLLKITWTYI